MKTFKQYDITEAKNVHMTHLEDLIFEGSARTEEAISFLEEIAKMLNGNSKTKQINGRCFKTCGIRKTKKSIC